MPNELQQESLLRAINNRDVEEFKDLLNSGANPFGHVETKRGEKVRLFDVIITTSDIGIVEATLEYALDNNIFIDLGRMATNKHNFKTINLLQYIKFRCPPLVLNKFDDYAKKTNQDIAALSNKCIEFYDRKNPEKICTTTLGKVMVSSLSRDSIIYNLCLNIQNLSPGKRAKLEKDLFKWSYAKQSEQIPSFDTPVRIIWQGPYSSLEQATKHDLNLEYVEEELDLINELSKDINCWDELKSKLNIYEENNSTNVIGSPWMDQGNIAFIISVKNKYLVHPLSFEVVIDVTDSLNLVREVKQARLKKDPAVAHIAIEQKKLAAKQDQMAKTLSTVPSVMIDEIKEILREQTEYPGAVDFFDIIQKRSKICMDAMLIATSDRFKVKANTKAAKVALAANEVIKVLSSNTSIPLMGIVGSISTGIVDLSTQYFANKQNEGALNALLNQNVERVSIYVATTLLCYAMNNNNAKDVNKKLAENLSIQVKDRIDNLHGLKDKKELFNFLCSTSLKTLADQSKKSPKEVKANSQRNASSSQGSNHSTSDGSTPKALPAFEKLKKTQLAIHLDEKPNTVPVVEVKRKRGLFSMLGCM